MTESREQQLQRIRRGKNAIVLAAVAGTAGVASYVGLTDVGDDAASRHTSVVTPGARTEASADTSSDTTGAVAPAVDQGFGDPHASSGGS